MDTPEQEQADQLQDRQWLDGWRATWPEGSTVDPHDPESFGFSFVGEVIGTHGLHGDVKVRIDDDLYLTGFEFNDVLLRRAYSNWDEKPKRVHLKAPHRRFPRAFRILRGFKVNNRIYGLRLHGVDDVNEAAQMAGYKVYTLSAPPTAEEVAKKQLEMSVEELYHGRTTTFATRDAMELIGAKCVMVSAEAREDVLGEFAAAETSEKAKEVLTAAGVETVTFGDLTAVVPDHRMNRRYKGRKSAHDLLDITIRPEVQAGEGKYLFEPDPKSLLGKSLQMNKFRPYDPLMDRVVYIPFAADLIARVDADESGVTAYFTLPPNYLQATSFTCRKRIINDQGLLAIPRASPVRALLPPAGKSHALRRRDGKNLPLHGTAPAAPLDMPMPAGMAFPEPSPGVPRPPLTRPHGGIDYTGRKRDSDFLRNMKRRIKEQQENKVAEEDFRRK